jgi:hypothetical protein
VKHFGTIANQLQSFQSSINRDGACSADGVRDSGCGNCTRQICTCANSDSLTVCHALALLGAADVPTARIAIVHPPALMGSPQRATAWTNGDDTIIWVDAGSQAFKRAAKGDAIALAAVLAHEAYHVAHGPAEGPAYTRQLDVLHALGARARDVDDVERAMQAVTSSRR